MKDGSLRADIAARDRALILVRTWTSLAQRLLTRDHILSIDDSLDPDKRLRSIREMVLGFVTFRA
jgi:hypothetical protein